MKKNGFTLIELLAVIIIISLIALITIIAVTPIVNDSESELSSIQKKKIEEATEAYYIKEGIKINDTCISAQELISKGYIEPTAFELVATSESNLGYVKILTASNGVVSYKYQLISCE